MTLYHASMRETAEQNTAEPVGAKGFVEGASACLRQAQAALTDLLDDAGVVGARPSHIGRELGLDKTLAWKLARFVEDPEPVGAARHMPGSAGVEIVLKAAASRGVGAPRLKAVRDADKKLRDYMRLHAGDRRSFEAMLAQGGRDDRIEFEERRSLYRSGSAIWGVRAKTQTLTLLLRPSADDADRIDILQLGGLIGFERLRADVPWIIRRLTVRSDSGVASPVSREPLDPAVPSGGALPIIREMCDGEIPEIVQFEGPNNITYDELAPSTVGRHGAVTIMTGEIYRSIVPMRRSEDNTEGRYRLSVRTPVEAVVFDVLFHKDMTMYGAPETRVYGLVEDRPLSGDFWRTRKTLYDTDDAQALGDPPRMQSARIPGYARMIERAMEMGNWGSLSDYRGYRAELSYPPVPCDIGLVSKISE